jgi:hypothetical protein
MSEYTLDVIPLTEGLDFNTATSLAKPGSLRDCLNYEFVDGAGLKRIDGMRLYDGNMRNKIDKVFYIVVEGSAISDNSLFAENPWLYLDTNDNPNKIPFGYMCSSKKTIPFDDSVGGGPIIPFIRLNCPSYADPSFSSGDIKSLNSAVLTVSEGTYTIKSLGALTDAQITAAFASSLTSVDEEVLLAKGNKCNYVSLKDLFSAGFVTDIPTDVVWSEKLNGKTFQIGDAFVVNGVASKQVYPGDYVYFNSLGMGNEYPLLVLSSSVDGSWTAGTDVATLHVVSLMTSSLTEYTYRPVKPQVVVGEADTDVYLYRHSSVALTDISIGKLNDDSSITYRPDIAVMYEVSDEETAQTATSVFSVSAPSTEGTQYDLTNDAVTASSGDAEAMPLISGGAVKAVIPTKRGTSYTSAPTFTIDTSSGTAASSPVASLTNTINRTNWQFVHTGWKVTFDAGNRSYGYLNKIDRYRDIDGNTYSTTSSVTSLEANKLIGRITGIAPGVTNWFTHSGNGTHRWENFGLWRNQVGVSDESTMLGNVDTASDSEYIYQKISSSSAPAQGKTAIVTLNSFPGLSAIPEGSSVKGIKITAIVDDGGTTTTIPASLGLYGVLGIVRQNEVGGYVEKSFGSAQEFLTSGNNSLQAEITDGMASTTFTCGGSSNIFGASSIPIEDLLDPDFSIGLYIQSDIHSTATQFEVRIDHIYIDVYYELPSVRYYFADAAKNIVLHGDLVDYVVSSGSFEAGDAEGVLTVVNLRTIKAASALTTGNSSTPYYTVVDNMDIYQDSGLTVKVGVVNGNMEFNGFDSYRTIKQNGSRYTSIRANFFANDEYEAYYICSGTGRAGIWDGKYWSRIYAINPKQENSDTLDKPRHVGEHSFHLFLGYKSGSVLFSAPGDPSNFSAFDGAGEIGIGDKIHGFNRLQGNAFGVFCEESIHAITGTDVSNFTKQILVPNEGALEYSVASFGSRVIFTSKTGITTLDQSEKYGNFLGRKLSFDVNPWLIPRVTSGAGLFTSIVDFNPVFEAGNGFVCAYAVPHKNQYRVWFKDGLQLWMTLVADDQPKFTFVQYFVGSYSEDSILALPVFPNYVSSMGETNDQNYVLFCPDREFIYAVEKSNGALYPDGVSIKYAMPGIYSLDVGDSFEAGHGGLALGQGRRGVSAIPHYALINYQYLKNPFTSKTLRKVRIEGQTRGCAPLTVYCEDGYKTSAQEVRTTGTNISLPKVPLDELKQSFKPESTLANVAATGRVLSLLVVGESLTNDPYFTTTGTDSLTSTRTTVPTPSHYLQAMLVQFSEEGTQDA